MSFELHFLNSMARFQSIGGPGYPYRITHRRNRGEDVFFHDDDRQVYI